MENKQYPEFSSLIGEIIDSISEGIIICNKQGDIVYANNGSYRLFGYDHSKNELLGKTVDILLPESLQAVHQKHRQHYNQSPKNRPMGIGLDLQGRKKNGELFYVEISLTHFYKNNELYIAAFITDITLRIKYRQELESLNKDLEKKVNERTRLIHKAHHELKKNQMLYEAIARNFPKGTINVFDRNFNYIFAEGQDLYKYGITTKNLFGKNYLDKIPKKIKQTIKNKLEQVLEGQSFSCEIEYENDYYLIHAVPLFNEHNEIENILLVEQNISDQKRAEQEIQAALQKEKELNEMKNRFVSMASHEFRTPLSTIHSSIVLIEKYLQNNKLENIPKHIHKIKNSISNLISILNDFLSFSKLEEGKITTNIQPVNIHQTIEQCISAILDLTKAGQVININSSDPGVSVNTDPNILNNILLNLISNAIKYSPSHTTIDVNSYTEGNKVIISVKDNGIGIPEKDQKYIFQRFFRAHNALNIEGTGLGLNIVKKYAEMLQAEIYFESKEGIGTTFYIALPLNSSGK
jgi:PAS domain S-box-containing protein